MDTMTMQSTLPRTEPKALKLMGLAESLLLFGIPAAALAFATLWLWPTLVKAGMDLPGGYALSIILVCGGLLIASVVGYVREGNLFTWTAFAQRMRLTGMNGRAWRWFLVGLFLYFILSGVSALASDMAYKALNFTPPNTMDVVMPAWMTGVVLFFNIAGEELWWRGYIFPRQELAFGRRTWLLHGILWACFHIFKWYEVPFLLMVTWVIPFIAQRTKNTWPGIIYHTLYNVAGVIFSTAG